MVLVAAVGALLNLRTGRDEVAIGIPTSGRHQSEAAGVVGLFVNTLVLRVDTSVSTTFTALLDDIRSRARGAYAHQDLPFERLVDELNPRRSGDRHPLFQVMVALQVDGSGPGTLGGMPLRAVPVEWGANRFDLGFTFAESADDLVVRIEFDRRAFDDAEIERLVGQLQQLLSVVVGDPDVSLEGGMLAEGSDRDHVLDELSGRVRPLDVDCPLQDRVSFHSGSRPDAVAVTFGSESLTYDELEAKSNQMARWLADRGVGPGTLVGVCLERSLDLPIALLGILRAGGAFVPLDPAAPDDRLRFMLDDADVPVVVTSGSSAERVTGRGRTLVLVDVDGPAIGAMPADRPATPVGPDDPAYVIYTSGSTGEPKGVLVEHRGVTNLVEVVEDVFRIDSTSRVLQFASYAFDASVTELLVPLALGATVVMAPASVLASGRGLLDLMDAQRVSVATLPPSLLAVLPDADLPALRTLCSAGEVCPPDVARRWSRGRRFLNGYGPTEATVAVSYAILGDGGAIDEGRLPIGRPIANARAYVVDRTGALVPVGVPGELWIGGAGVARGYLNRPELSAERFVADPFTGAGRLFTTGDRVRWRGDGQLEFLGRMDDQVKLRGFRIELGEIEAVLRAHTAVRDAAAMVREDTPGVARLVAYVVPEPGEAEASGQLRSWSRRRLPDYMVPSSVVEVDALPRTLNGKVDRGALPVPEELAGGEDPAGGPEVELSSSEEQVAAVFRELLGIGSIGSDDDFFDVGGNSLLATQLFARIETRFGVSLPLATLFEDATVASVACAVDQARGRSGDPAHAEVPPGPATGAEPAPLVETELVARLKSGDGPTLFLIHELTGEVIVYRDLVKSLPEDVAVYGLRARGIDRKVLPTRRLEEIAAHYIEEIRAQQAEGPYFVGGLCFGGVVALEVAHQLEEQGGTVGLVVPIDAMPRNVKRQDLSPFARIDAELTRLASTRLGRSLQPRLAPVAGRMGRWGDELWRRVTVAIQARGYTPPHRLDNIERSLGRAMRHYARSPRIGAPVLLVRADRGQELNRRAVDRWQQATSAPVVPVMVRGEQVDHRSMVRAPYVSQVTEPLGRALSEGVQILFHESMGGG
jgi:amino acid adenylation domain-containing protein